MSCESARSLGQCLSRRWRWVLNLAAVVHKSDVLLTELLSCSGLSVILLFSLPVTLVITCIIK